ncbi:MAG: hypothetical protein IPK07_20115 [Deltaproteobacteria bacterium]|jgi:hypothetical protein|nr:hypothetical protein [Deltaproteobacteria bacterium]
MSRSRKHYTAFSPRTGTLRRGARHNDRDGLPAQIEGEYGWDPRHATHDRLWLQASAPVPEDGDGEPTRAVRSFDLLDDDES